MPDFSTPSHLALERPISPPLTAVTTLAPLSLSQQFDIDSTIDHILAHSTYLTVALQFPDELLGQSVMVYRTLMVGLKRAGWQGQCFVLGDSTYGSCCPDVLSCQHLPADFLVHYGHACLTPTSALPVLYIFPKSPLSPPEAAKSLFAAASANWSRPTSSGGKGKKLVVVLWDVAFDYLSREIGEEFGKSIYHPEECDVQLVLSRINKESALFPSLSTSTDISSLPAPASSEQHNSPTPPSSLRSVEIPEGWDKKDATIFYLGEEGRGMVNLMMENASNHFYQFSPSLETTTALHTRTPLLLRRRFFSLSQALSCSVFGLLVHNVGLSSSQTLLSELRELLKRKGRKSYTVSVGRVNPAKLGNFEVVECWILVGCREGGLVDSKDFYRPVITPYELILALEGEKGVARWDPSNWTLDFEKVLDGAPDFHAQVAKCLNAESGLLIASTEIAPADRVNEANPPAPAPALLEPQREEQEKSEEDDDTPVFSLVSGQYHQPARHAAPAASSPDPNGTVAIRNNDWSLSRLEGAASKHLQTRSWVGLDPTEGYGRVESAFEPAELVDGRKGIARGYGEEEKHRV